MVIDVIGCLVKSERSCCNQIDSWAALDNATYSASAVERTITGLLFTFQLMAVPPI